MQLGVIIGRFQVPELTDGHKKLISHVRQQHGKVLIAVGCIVSKERTKRDPLDYGVREAMIKEFASDALVIPVMDCPGNDEMWSQNLDATLRAICPTGQITLYGGRDSFIPHYKGNHNTYKIELEFSPSGTDIREFTGNRIRVSGDFRAGVIYSMMNMYQRVYPTVDIAIISDGHVLMGRKPNEDLWRLPGGFVDIRDGSLEEAAAREAQEETGILIDPKDLIYLGSVRTTDGRYNPEKDDAAITTTLFVAEKWKGYPKAADDIKEVLWHRVARGFRGFTPDPEPVRTDKVHSYHQPLFRMLMERYIDYKIKGENTDVQSHS
jgi:bifunctional NMN adenylyltransferase/nudix hydrolase